MDKVLRKNGHPVTPKGMWFSCETIPLPQETLSVASYFPFCQIKIIDQMVTAEAPGAHIQEEPDNRFCPICRGCGQKASEVHSWTQRKAIKAVAMDMWDPFIKAVRDKLPLTKIVFDLFHVGANFNRVIDKVRNREYHKASKDDKAVYKGAKYLLLKNRKNIRRQSHRQQLKELLALSHVLTP